MLIAMSDDNRVSKDKSPSPELVSLMGAAATGMLAFGELWDTVKQKGASEGFDEKALLTLFAPMVKDKFTAAQVRYLMNKEKEQERARDNRAKQKDELKSLRTYAHIPPKKEPEQTSTQTELTEDQALAEIKEINEYKKQEIEREPDEDPKDLEIQFLKDKVTELEDALKKTQQFKPATAYDVPTTQVYQAEEVTIFELLRKRGNGINVFYYDTYGIELFQNRILSQLKNSGVKVFKRLYFEV